MLKLVLKAQLDFVDFWAESIRKLQYWMVKANLKLSMNLFYAFQATCFVHLLNS